ncbi:MAG: nitroreductase/quinone reductase family protein [Myxococcota bacterium]|nr:nitroreductase family deazaflavin-dependent oxidoreductase [Myxococcales bacterium]
MSDQKSEEFETPDRAAIPGITRAHVAEMEASNDDAVWVRAGMAHMLVRTLGRKSGREHKVALPYWLDAQGRPVVVGSYAGAPQHPAWYLNLADRSANPEVFCRFQHEDFWARADVLDGDEYRAVWDALTTDRAYYRDYQKLTERRLPLVRFAKLRSA